VKRSGKAEGAAPAGIVPVGVCATRIHGIKKQTAFWILSIQTVNLHPPSSGNHSLWLMEIVAEYMPMSRFYPCNLSADSAALVPARPGFGGVIWTKRGSLFFTAPMNRPQRTEELFSKQVLISSGNSTAASVCANNRGTPNVPDPFSNIRNMLQSHP
jgi:hypothetical protein